MPAIACQGFNGWAGAENISSLITERKKYRLYENVIGS